MAAHRVYYLDTLRLLATFFVVVLHTGSACYAVFALSGSDGFMARLYHFASTFAVPVFLMISGSLFLGTDRELGYDVIFRKYIRRIVLALLVFGLPMCFLEVLMTRNGGLYIAIVNFLTGRSWDHMWYLYMLAGLYALTPVLKPFLQHSTEKTATTGMLVLAVPCIVLPSLKSYGVALEGWLVLAPYPFYYLLGGYLGGRQVNLPVGVPVAMLAMFIASQAGRVWLGADCPAYHDMATCLGAVAVFLLLQRSNRPHMLAGRMAPYCFSVYILHPVFINVAFKLLHVNPSVLCPLWIGILLFALLFFMQALASGWVLRQLPLFRKYIL